MLKNNAIVIQPLKQNCMKAGMTITKSRKMRRLGRVCGVTGSRQGLGVVKRALTKHDWVLK